MMFRQRRPAFVTLVVLAVTMSACVRPVASWLTNGARITRLERRLSELETELFGRLGDVEGVVTDLAQQECETNQITIDDCEESVPEEGLFCVDTSIIGNNIIEEFEVPLTKSFASPPVVQIALNGQTFQLGGKNCSITINFSTNSSFNFTYASESLFPTASQATYYACPGAMFAANDTLPFPETNSALPERRPVLRPWGLDKGTGRHVQGRGQKVKAFGDQRGQRSYRDSDRR